jgi:hypothetical protein
MNDDGMGEACNTHQGWRWQIPKEQNAWKTRCRIDGTIIRRHFKYIRWADVTGIQLKAKLGNEHSGLNNSAGKLFFSTCAMLHEPRHHESRRTVDKLSLFIFPTKTTYTKVYLINQTQWNKRFKSISNELNHKHETECDLPLHNVTGK